MHKNVRLFLTLSVMIAVISNVIYYTQYAPIGSFDLIPQPSVKVILNSTSRIIDYPSGLLIKSDKLFYVAEGDRNRIILYSPQSGVIRKWGRLGQAPGEFHFPSSMDYLPNGNLAILDKLNERIQILSPDGQPIQVLSVGTSGIKGLAIFPDGIFYTSRNGAVYSSEPFFSVVGLRSDGKRVIQWKVDFPILDVRKEINNRLWVLTTQGLLLYSTKGKLIQRLAISNGNLNQPPIQEFSGMYQSANGCVYLFGKKCIMVYDKHYKPSGWFPINYFTRSALLNIVVDQKNQLWMADDQGNMFSANLSEVKHEF